MRAHARAERRRRTPCGASARCTRWIAQRPSKSAKLRASYSDASSVTSAMSKSGTQPAHQLGDAPAAAVARREHRERRDDEHARPGARASAARSRKLYDEPATVTAAPDGSDSRGGAERLRRARARAPMASTPAACRSDASSRWLA